MAQKALLARIAKPGSLTFDLTKDLKGALSPASLALIDAIVDEASRQHAPIYLVGGFVRDLLLGRPNLDLDFVLEGEAIPLGKSLQKRFGGRLLPHHSFGTAVWTLPEDKKKFLAQLGSNSKKGDLPEFVDLVSARQESYRRSGALPDVKFADIYADQSRRDFAINTLTLSLSGLRTGQLLDPWHGVADLRKGVVRVLHERSFADDPTRIFRAIRFAGRLGFKIEPATLRQLKSSLRFVNHISGDRIRRELELTLDESNFSAILASMQKLGVLKSVHAGFKWQPAMASLLRRSAISARGEWGLEGVSTSDVLLLLWFLQLPTSAIAAVTDRLRFTADMRATVVAASRLSANVPALRKMTTSRLVAALEREPLIAVFALYIINSKNLFGKKLRRYAKEWRHIRPQVDGDDLKRMGLKPGPEYRKILDQLRTAWLDGQVKTASQEKAMLKKVLNG